MKHSIIDYDCYPREDGKRVYYVTCGSKYGTFTGEVSPCDDDRESVWDGYDFAHCKCLLQMYKKRAEVLRERWIGIDNACKALHYSFASSDYKKLQRQADAAKRLYEEAKEIYNMKNSNFRKYTSERVKERAELNDRILQRRDNDNR